VADEERLRTGRGPQIQSARRLGRGRLPSPQNAAAEDAVLQLGGSWAGKRRHLDADSDEQRHDPADGAVGLPAGSGARLPRSQDWLGELLRQAGTGAGARRVNSGAAHALRSAVI
jgi:hypothetical protein